MNKPNILVICGPTATGKTKLSIEIALLKNGEIISADSMQIYKKMDIGTAKPTIEERQGVPHYLIDEIEPNEPFSVVKYKELAVKYIEKIIKENKLPIIVGGTGFYINSVIDNVEFSNYKVDYDYRNKLCETAEKEGGEKLKEMLFKVDETTALKLHNNDIKRLSRALEIFATTGKTQSYWNEQSILKGSPYNPIMLGLTYKNRDLLYEKINSRVDIMLENGLIDEVKELLNSGISENATSMQAIGYKELGLFLKGVISKEEATDKIKQESRRYAKRQLTWFRRDTRIKWFFIDENETNENNFKNIKKYMEIPFN